MAIIIGIIAVRAMYSNHITEMGAMLKKLSALDDMDQEQARKLGEEAEDFARRKAALYERLIALLLEKNGYSFDKAWWDENTDEIDRRTFIEKCLLKDSGSKQGKKKGKPEM